MLTSTKLFFIRLKQYYRYLLKSINSVLDWTVWVYIAIPMLVIGVGLYVDLWRQFPLWANGLPWEFIFIAVLGLLVVMGKLHIGVDKADQLVLLQQKNWLKSMKRWGLGYGALMTGIQFSLPTGLFLPFLLQGSELQLKEILLLLIHCFVVSVAVLMINYLLNNEGPWWKKLLRLMMKGGLAAILWLLPALGYILAEWPLHYISTAILPIVVLLVWIYDRAPFQYALQLRQEQDFRSKFTGMILSQVHENQSIRRWKRPWIFRKSQRLLKRNDVHYVIADLRIKSLLRSITVLQAWVAVVSVGSYALILVDGFGVWVVFAGLLFISRVWLSLQWEQWAAEQYVKLYIQQSERHQVQFAGAQAKLESVQVQSEGTQARSEDVAADVETRRTKGSKQASPVARAKKLSQHLLTIPGMLIWILVLCIKYF